MEPSDSEKQPTASLNIGLIIRFVLSQIRRYFAEFIGIFMVITFSFYVESKGEDYENRMTYEELLKDIIKELKLVQSYTLTYADQNLHIEHIYEQQLAKWDLNDDHIFFLDPKDPLFDEVHYLPMSTYTDIRPYDEPKLLFSLFEQGTLEFKLVSHATQIIEGLDEGNLIDQILLLNRQEKILVDDFKQRVKNLWTRDLGIIDLDDPHFWITHRTYIQQDHYLRHNLAERVDLWHELNSVLLDYEHALSTDIAQLDSINVAFENEGYFIYWQYR